MTPVQVAHLTCACGIAPTGTCRVVPCMKHSKAPIGQRTVQGTIPPCAIVVALLRCGMDLMTLVAFRVLFSGKKHFPLLGGEPWVVETYMSMAPVRTQCEGASCGKTHLTKVVTCGISPMMQERCCTQKFLQSDQPNTAPPPLSEKGKIDLRLGEANAQLGEADTATQFVWPWPEQLSTLVPAALAVDSVVAGQPLGSTPATLVATTGLQRDGVGPDVAIATFYAGGFKHSKL